MTEEYRDYNGIKDFSSVTNDTTDEKNNSAIDSIANITMKNESLKKQKITVNQTDKQIPHNLEIEASIIGAILKNNNLLEKADVLRPEHFYAPENQILFKWILELTGRNQLASPKTLSHLADNEPAISELGGKKYLAKLASDVFSVVNVAEFANTIEDLFVKRQLITLGEEIILDGYNQNIENTGEKQIEKAEQSLFNLAETGDIKKQIIGLGTALNQTLEQAEKAFLNPSGLAGITTGFRDLDKQMGGLHQSDLLILAGRPAMGKTSLATNIAFNAANAYSVEVDEKGNKISNGGVVLFFSLEMSSEQLATRIISEQAEIPSNKIRLGEINEEQFKRLAEKSSKLSNTQLYIDDTPGISVTSLRQRARRIQRQHGLDLIVVDYLQLLQGPAGKKFDNRVNEISEITRSLKIVAKELNIPVIALSQLSRSVEQREDKRPILSDLRESGSIEQDADLVMFIYRPEYYISKKSPPERNTNESESKFMERVEIHNSKLHDARNKAEIIIAKQRHGPSGTIELFFNAEFTRFGDLDTKHYED